MDLKKIKKSRLPAVAAAAKWGYSERVDLLQWFYPFSRRLHPSNALIEMAA